MASWEAAYKYVQSRFAAASAAMQGAWNSVMGETPDWTQPWPPPEDKERLEGYRRYQQLYHGDHETVYVTNGKYAYDDKRDFIVVNMCGEITDLMVDRLFGAPPTLKTAQGIEAAGIEGGQEQANDPSTQWLRGLVTRSKLDTLLIQMGTGTSYRGDGCLKIRHDRERGGVVLSALDPTYLFVTPDEDNSDVIREAMVGYIRWHEGTPYVMQEIHTPGEIRYELYELHGDPSRDCGYTPERDRRPLETIPALADLPEGPTSTGVDDILLVPIALGADDSDEIFGRSDYADVESLQGELDNRATQRGEVLDKHGDPWMFGPEIANKEGEIDNKRRYINVREGEPTPAYLYWDSAQEAVRQEIRELIEQIILTAGLSPESFQLPTQGAAESGRALKLRQFRTASAVQMRQRTWGEALRRAVAIASQLATARKDADAVLLQAEEVRIDWQDSLPVDRLEQVQTEQIMVDAGLRWRRTSVSRLNPDMTEAEIQQELDGIDEDRQAGEVDFGFGDVFEPVEAGQPAGSKVSNSDRENVRAQDGAQTTVGNPQTVPRGGGGD